MKNNSELDQLILAHITTQSGFHAGKNTIGDVDEAGNKIKYFFHQELQKAREGWLEEMEREIADLRAEHANTARHGNDPDSAYDRVEGMLWNKKQSNHSELVQPTEEIPGFEGTIEVLGKI